MDKDYIPFNVHLDLSKAFDTLNNSILIKKLKYYGINHRELSLFKSYMANHKQFVDIEGTTSDMLSLMTGVTQGSVLGPLLFIIYMNDLSYASNIFKHIIYADDSTLTSILQAFNVNCNNNNTNDQINSKHDQINDWLKLNKLSLNESKSKYMFFSHTPENNCQPETTEKCSRKVKNFNFLGVVLYEHLNWKSHV